VIDLETEEIIEDYGLVEAVAPTAFGNAVATFAAAPRNDDVGGGPQGRGDRNRGSADNGRQSIRHVECLTAMEVRGAPDGIFSGETGMDPRDAQAPHVRAAFVRSFPTASVGTGSAWSGSGSSDSDSDDEEKGGYSAFPYRTSAERVNPIGSRKSSADRVAAGGDRGEKYARLAADDELDRPVHVANLTKKVLQTTRVDASGMVKSEERGEDEDAAEVVLACDGPGRCTKFFCFSCAGAQEEESSAPSAGAGAGAE
jgi:hypothetical protein